MTLLLLALFATGTLALSTRLEHCASLAARPFADGTAPRGLCADVCCDHGYLAAELVARGRDVAAVDICDAPLENCRRHFAERGLAPRAFVLGDGVAALQTSELPWAETAIVAGVGARTATEILEASCALPDPPRRFVLQPTMQFIAYAHKLRKSLRAHGYQVVEERWLDENRDAAKYGLRYFLTICADRAAGAPEPSERELLVGLPSSDPARAAYLRHHHEWLANLARDLPPGARKRVQAEAWLPLVAAELDEIAS